MSNKNQQQQEEEGVVELQRHVKCKALREAQEIEANRRVTRRDIAIAVVSILMLRKITNALNISIRFSTVSKVLLLITAIGIYRGKHPGKTLPRNAGDFPVWPIVGQVLQGMATITCKVVVVN